MTIKFIFAQFLTTHGVPRAKANSVAAGIDAKILKRQPLTCEEAALTQAFLSRPGANPVAQQYVAAAVNSSASGRAPPGARVVPSQVKVLLLSPKASRGLSQRPGPPAIAGVNERHQGATILTSNMRGSVGIRTLVDRIH